MVSLKRLVVSLAFALAAVSASAQEFDIFDLNDFIDPRERGAEFGPKGVGVTEPGNPFSVIRATSGGILDYQWRNLPTDTNVTFFHLTGSHYWSNKQLNLKLTSFGGPEGASLPRLRGTIQFGYYLTTEQPPDAKGERPPPIAVRYLVSCSREDQKSGSANNEFGLEADVQLALPAIGGKPQRTAVGSFVWVRKYVGDGATVDRLTYVDRAVDRRYGAFHVATDVGIGVERDPDAWHWGAIRPVVMLSYPIPFLQGAIDLTYAPSWVPRTGRRLHHEAGLFIDTTLFTHLSAK